MNTIHLALLVVSVAVIKNVRADCDGSTKLDEGVTQDEINTIVDTHNGIRRLICQGQPNGQPQGVNLKKMSWDDQLAQKAQEISNTCKFEHVSVEDDRFWWVGQNLFMTLSSGPYEGRDWVGGVQAWASENSTYTYSNTDYEHYTQVVWADSYLVGCGYTYFEVSDNDYRKMYVCNYGPGGNIQGQYPYETGNSGCPEL